MKIPNIHMEFQETQNSKNNLEKKMIQLQDSCFLISELTVSHHTQATHYFYNHIENV